LLLLARGLGAIALVAVGVVHLQQYSSDYYRVVPVIGTLFLLNFIGAVGLAIVLLAPTGAIVDRLVGRGGPLVVALAAAGAVALAASSFVFLLISERTMLFGFHEYGYRTAVVVALVTEPASSVLLLGYLAGAWRARRADHGTASTAATP
jgi:hypothetical protein